MRKVGFTLLLLVLLIAAANNPARAEEEIEEQEQEEVSFKKAVSEFAKSMKAVRKYIIQQAEKRKFEETEIKLLAEIIYWENWFTDKAKIAAYRTGAVVMNRVKSPKWPNTVYDVAYERGQYSTTKYFYTKEIPEECYEMAKDIYYNGTPDVPYNVVFQATFKQGYGDWDEPINGEHFCYGDA